MSEDDLWGLFHAVWGDARHEGNRLDHVRRYDKARWVELQRKLEQLERLALPVDPVAMYQVRCQNGMDLAGHWIVAATSEAMAIVAVKIYLTQSRVIEERAIVAMPGWTAWETAVPVRVK